MDTPNKKADGLKKTFLELEKQAKDINEKLRLFLQFLPKDEMISRIQELNLSDKSLNFLCEGIALEKEDYEICAAVEEIKRLRKLSRDIAVAI